MQPNARHAAITFTANDYEPVTCLIDAPGISVSGDSYGGWDVIQRPRNVGLLDWTGFEPMTMEIPVLFDNWTTQKSIEDDILALEKLAGRGPGAGGRRRPPEITLKAAAGFGSLIPHNFNGESLQWVITDLDLPADDALRRRAQPDGSGGHRVRQAGTVTVKQYVHDERLEEMSVAKRRNSHGRRRKTHVVKRGETLQAISRKEYGTADRWQDIAVHNGIRDPRHLKAGKRLKLPK